MLSSLSIYKGVLTRSVPSAFHKLLLSVDEEPETFLNAYGDFYRLLCDRNASNSLSYTMTEAALFDENYFTRTATADKVSEMSEDEKKAVVRDIDAILFASQITPKDVINDYKYKEEIDDIIDCLPKWHCGTPSEEFVDFNDNLDKIAKFHREKGCGMFARYRSFVWRDKGIEPIINDDKVRISDLVDYEYQRDLVVENTRAFIEGRNANNCLLYGDMGTGKSTTVKATVNEFRRYGLRIVEIPKEKLMEFPLLIDAIAQVPMKFIIFIDDLSFQRQDECYTSLKAVLEGGVAALPKNALIYATSNRRHLVRKHFLYQIDLVLQLVIMFLTREDSYILLKNLQRLIILIWIRNSYSYRQSLLLHREQLVLQELLSSLLNHYYKGKYNENSENNHMCIAFTLHIDFYCWLQQW